MSEQGWDDGIEAPPQKRGIPGWLWFCGGGCLLVVVVGIALVIWGASAARKWMDPEEQWPRLAEVLPFDERPPHLEMQMGMHAVVDMYFLTDDRGYFLQVWELDASEADEFQRALEPGFSGQIPGVGELEETQRSQVSVQGRELVVQRGYLKGVGGRGPGGGGGFQLPPGQTAIVDLTPPDHPGFVPVFIVRERGDEDPVSDDEIRDVLAGFKIGPEYTPPEPGAEEPPIEEAPAEPPEVDGGVEADEDGR